MAEKSTDLRGGAWTRPSYVQAQNQDNWEIGAFQSTSRTRITEGVHKGIQGCVQITHTRLVHQEWKGDGHSSPVLLCGTYSAPRLGLGGTHQLPLLVSRSAALLTELLCHWKSHPAAKIRFGIPSISGKVKVPLLPPFYRPWQQWRQWRGNDTMSHLTAQMSPKLVVEVEFLRPKGSKGGSGGATQGQQWCHRGQQFVLGTARGAARGVAMFLRDKDSNVTYMWHGGGTFTMQMNLVQILILSLRNKCITPFPQSSVPGKNLPKFLYTTG
ncbi:hypothetical protein K438DRAFT_1757363 [Mycena galopus ATCC 62051]|nr:hypothetical protein K438DRAFT_1757363 [Mycena galopus ATCC 62051]